MQVSCVFINFHTKITLRPLQYNTNYSRMDRVLISIIVIIIYTINEFDCMNLKIEFGRIGLVPYMHIFVDSIIECPKLGEQMDRVILTLMIYSYISFFHQWNEFF